MTLKCCRGCGNVRNFSQAGSENYSVFHFSSFDVKQEKLSESEETGLKSATDHKKFHCLKLLFSPLCPSGPLNRLFLLSILLQSCPRGTIIGVRIIDNRNDSALEVLPCKSNGSKGSIWLLALTFCQNGCQYNEMPVFTLSKWPLWLFQGGSGWCWKTTGHCSKWCSYQGRALHLPQREECQWRWWGTILWVYLLVFASVYVWMYTEYWILLN